MLRQIRIQIQIQRPGQPPVSDLMKMTGTGQQTVV
jgi:hypothetical protein